MCGILCLISNPSVYTCLQALYDECKKQIDRRGPNAQKSYQICINNNGIQMYAGVLWLQGEEIVQQPVNTIKSLFLYNGDIFGGTATSGDDCMKHGDTKLFLDRLESQDNIIESLSNLHGPFGFIYLDKVKSKLHFGRDAFGRRSLLISVDKQNNAMLISSVAVRSLSHVIELPAIGIFCFDLVSNDYHLDAWPKKHKNFDIKLSAVKDVLGCDIAVFSSESIVVNEFIKPQPSELSIFEELKQHSVDKAFALLLNNYSWKENVLQLNMKLENAVRRRIITQPRYCKDCLVAKGSCNHCHVGILFSGGIDCTLLALIADKFIDQRTPIDLLNVAFAEADNYNTPDRITGLQSLAELQSVRPHRRWNFVSINVPRPELDAARRTHIVHLIYPLNSILDDSLGCALWFASRGKGDGYESPCRVLLVGTGADELFGGYTRHRAAFRAGGWSGLHDVLVEDWANIAHRNLARDDRVVADHGRQLRTPYLDEEVVDFVQSLRVWEKTYPSSDLAPGVGEKILLRALAYYLGLRCASSLRKRALQFGSRIANKKENAHEVSPRLTF